MDYQESGRDMRCIQHIRFVGQGLGRLRNWNLGKAFNVENVKTESSRACTRVLARWKPMWNYVGWGLVMVHAYIKEAPPTSGVVCHKKCMDMPELLLCLPMCNLWITGCGHVARK